MVRSEGAIETTVLDGFTITGGSDNGMFNNYSSPTITNCIFSGNLAERWGGGMKNHNSSQTITNCIFSGNSAYESGGGMYNHRSSPTIANCTFSGNSAGTSGGGMYNYEQSSPTVINCTFSGNSALSGNDCACDSFMQNSPSEIEMTNCILWSGGQEIWNNNGSTITISYTDLQNGQAGCFDPCNAIVWGMGNIDADPCFVNPGYWDANGHWVEGDYHLLDGSPCIDIGDPNYAAAAGETDLDGNPRVVDGDNDGNSVVDMGACEVQVAEPADLILELADDVIALNLQEGIENSLMAKLNASLGALEDENENNDIAAINTLGAFINAVEAQRGKKILEAEADDLIAAAQEIIDLLSNG